ncbi:response regulator transcription factor [Thermoleophilia bacterium SCSIO 60948]|nr:response regulator transcription factor [Thermoleophilia bacterium SCSIO 60948]
MSAVPLVARVLLADDHAMVRRGLRMVLDSEADLEVVAEASDGRDAVARVLAEPDLDLAILDITMPRQTGIQAARELRARRPELRIVMLSMHDDEQYLFEAMRLGARGYVLKSAADRELVDVCRRALRGERFAFPASTDAATRELLERAHAEGAEAAEALTPRESEVVKLIAEGFTNREIAGDLVISEKTVERHRANILEKLGMRDRVELTRYAIRRGLVQP